MFRKITVLCVFILISTSCIDKSITDGIVEEFIEEKPIMDVATQSEQKIENAEPEVLVEETLDIDEVAEVMEEILSDIYIKVFADRLNVRDEHLSDSEVVDVVLVNSVHKVEDTYHDEALGNWFKITTDEGITGWIAGWYCVEVDIENDTADFFVLNSLDFNDELLNKHQVEFSFEQEEVIYVLNFDFDLNGEEEKLFIRGMLGDSVSIEYKDTVYTVELNDGILSFGILDVDSSDGNYELYFLSNYIVGPQAEYLFYQVKEDGLTNLGHMNSMIVHVDGNGAIYYWGGQLHERYKGDFDYDLVIDYYDLYSNSYVNLNNPIGKSFPAPHEVVVFKEKEFLYWDVWEYMDWVKEEHEGEYVDILQDGDIFTVHEIDYGDYRVTTENGNEGWITGFHFYID